MPCYEVRTVSVEFKAENRHLLAEAIRATGMEVMANSTNDLVTLGYGAIVLDLESGQAKIQDGQQGNLNKLKRAYSKEAVKAACKRVQWSAKWQGQQATVTKVQW